jgi:HD-GYP domain-containing protein (c-di-GMP phosphodiesterase class II)
MDTKCYSAVKDLIYKAEEIKRPENNHAENVARLSVRIAGLLDKELMDDVVHLTFGAQIHDIGKLFLDDFIINAPRKLTLKEMIHVQTHTQFGFELVFALDYHKIICDIVRYHHENWNGSGYPTGLAGENIPLPARIVRVADTFDAMTSNRVYRKSGMKEDAMLLLSAEAGVIFDERVVQALKEVLENEAP